MNPASAEANRSFAIAFRRSWVQSHVPALAVHMSELAQERETNVTFLSEYGPKIPQRI